MYRDAAHNPGQTALQIATRDWEGSIIPPIRQPIDVPIETFRRYSCLISVEFAYERGYLFCRNRPTCTMPNRGF